MSGILLTHDGAQGPPATEGGLASTNPRPAAGRLRRPRVPPSLTGPPPAVKRKTRTAGVSGTKPARTPLAHTEYIGWDCAHKSLAWARVRIDLGVLNKLERILGGAPITDKERAVAALNEIDAALAGLFCVLDGEVVDLFPGVPLSDTNYCSRAAALRRYLIGGAGRFGGAKHLIEHQATAINGKSTTRSAEVSYQLALWFSSAGDELSGGSVCAVDGRAGSIGTTASGDIELAAGGSPAVAATETEPEMVDSKWKCKVSFDRPALTGRPCAPAGSSTAAAAGKGRAYRARKKQAVDDSRLLGALFPSEFTATCEGARGVGGGMAPERYGHLADAIMTVVGWIFKTGALNRAAPRDSRRRIIRRDYRAEILRLAALAAGEV